MKLHLVIAVSPFKVNALVSAPRWSLTWHLLSCQHSVRLNRKRMLIDLEIQNAAALIKQQNKILYASAHSRCRLEPAKFKKVRSS